MNFESIDVDVQISTNTTTNRLADRVYEAVKGMVFNFELLPGTRFSEADLTQRLNVSRTPLRQALQKLESQGFLQVLPKMGWFVAPIDFDVMDELYDLRILMECHSVQILCEMSMLVKFNFCNFYKFYKISLGTYSNYLFCIRNSTLSEVPISI